jgi:hypothetical protein
MRRLFIHKVSGKGKDKISDSQYFTTKPKINGSHVFIFLLYLIIIEIFLICIHLYDDQFIYFPKKKVLYVCVRKKKLERDKSEEKKKTNYNCHSTNNRKTTHIKRICIVTNVS